MKFRFLVPVALSLLVACGGPRPSTLGPVEGELAPCPPTPNCVHTGNRHPSSVDPLVLAPGWREAPPGRLWPLVEEGLASLPRVTLVTRQSGYLHAEVRSRFFRFVDDVEVLLDWPRGELVVRSASRVGRSDLGVNAARVEELRDRWIALGVLIP